MAFNTKRDFAKVVKRTEIYKDPPSNCADDGCRATIRGQFFVGARGCLCARCAMEGGPEDRKMKFVNVSKLGAPVYKRTEV
jgi:hypothetical protein